MSTGDLQKLLEEFEQKMDVVQTPSESSAQTIDRLADALAAAEALIGEYQQKTEIVDAPGHRYAVYLKALETVQEANRPPLKPNNYPVDGWRPLPMSEVFQEARILAAFLLGRVDE